MAPDLSQRRRIGADGEAGRRHARQQSDICAAERESLAVGGIELPAERMHETWINVLTDETANAEAQDGGQGLGLARLFATFPYAMLAPHEAASGR